MKQIKALLAAAMVASFPMSTQAAVVAQEVNYIQVFFDDQYAEVGRWTFYCDGTSDLTGQVTGRHWDYYYGCS